jgi:outer membrane protein OmpA-like peptidoglycan-associated protein
MKSASGVNPWAAFADVLFMLFVTTLIASAVITHWAVRSEERLRGCGASRDFMVRFSACVGAPAHETENVCKVSLGEERLRFAEDQAVLADASQKFGRTLAACLVGQLVVAAEDPSLFDSIEFVAIDGYTDCVGDDRKNLRLGAARASTLYGFVLDDVDKRGLQPGLRAAVLSKVAIRTFGKSRPLSTSPCAVDPVRNQFAASAEDRRVEVAVNSRLVGGE